MYCYNHVKKYAARYDSATLFVDMMRWHIMYAQSHV